MLRDTDTARDMPTNMGTWVHRALTRVLALWPAAPEAADAEAVDRQEDAHFAGDTDLDEGAARYTLREWRQCVMEWSRHGGSAEGLWALAQPPYRGGSEDDDDDEGETRQSGNSNSSALPPHRAMLVVLYKCMLSSSNRSVQTLISFD